MKKHAVSMLSLSLVLLASGCGKEAITNGSPNCTVDVLSKIADQTLTEGNTSVRFSADGTFSLTYDTDVRYFPPARLNPDREGRESDARCIIKITGTSTFSDGSIRYVIPVAADLQLAIQEASVFSSSVIRSDENSVGASEVCKRYSASLVQKGTFDMPVTDYGQSFIAILQMGFDIPSTDAGSNYLFNSRNHRDNPYYYVARGSHGETNYLVSAGKKIDVTASTTAILAGEYLQKNAGSAASKVLINAKLNQILLSNGACSVVYKIDVTSIYFDSTSLQANLLPTEVTGFGNVPASETTADCNRLKTMLKNFIGWPAKLHYRVENDRNGNVTKKYFRLDLDQTLQTQDHLEFESVD